MKKFTFEHWADYVRGLTSPEQTRAMKEQLESGDPTAARLYQLAAGLHESAAWRNGPDAPRDVVQRAIALFAPIEPASLWNLPLLAARTIFDSFLEPQPAGLRTQGAQHRETIHEAGEFQLSLRLEQEHGTDVMALVGQLLPNENIQQAVSHRPVFVFQKEKLIARTLSGDNGEFQLEFSGRQPLRLVLALAHPDRRIELDLAPVGGSKKPSRKAPRSNS